MSREAVLGAVFAALIAAFWAGIACLWLEWVSWRAVGVVGSVAAVAAFVALGVGTGWR